MNIQSEHMEDTMRQNCQDAFFEHDLPFECYFNACVDHDEQIHDELEFIWLLKGHIVICCEGISYDLTSDHVFIIYINQRHSMKSYGDTISFSFRFKKDYLSALNLRFDNLPFKNRVFTFKELSYKYREVHLIMSELILLMKSTNSVVKTHFRLIGYYNIYLFDLYTDRLKNKYLDIKAKNYDNYLIRFYTIDDYIQKHYAEKLTLDIVAKEVGISAHRLSHFIKGILGISFQEYLNNVRLEKAIDQLKNTDRPIHKIVKECGFSDHKYLNAMMKGRFHLTALKFRRIMRDDAKHFRKSAHFSKMLFEMTHKLHQIHEETIKAPCALTINTAD